MSQQLTLRYLKSSQVLISVSDSLAVKFVDDDWNELSLIADIVVMFRNRNQALFGRSRFDDLFFSHFGVHT